MDADRWSATERKLLHSDGPECQNSTKVALATIKELYHWLQVCPACVKFHPSVGNVPLPRELPQDLLSSNEPMDNIHTHTHTLYTEHMHSNTHKTHRHLLTDTI